MRETVSNLAETSLHCCKTNFCVFENSSCNYSYNKATKMAFIRSLPPPRDPRYSSIFPRFTKVIVETHLNIFFLDN